MADPGATGSEIPIPITADMLLSRRVDFERRMRRFPPVTVAIVLLLAAVYVGEEVFEARDSTEAIVAAGALVRDAVLAGQYWRLVTPILLHGSFDHLAGNAIALFILGMVCEHAFGRAQFFVLFVAGGIAGSLVSCVTSAGPSVGASGAIFGLQGAAIVLFRRHRDRLLVRDRRIGFVLLVWAVYTILGGLATPWIDNGAHIGGFLGGVLVARRLHPTVLEPMPEATAARVRRAAAVTAGVCLYAAAGWIFR